MSSRSLKTFYRYLVTARFYVFTFLWPPCVADADIIFWSCGFFLLLLSFLAHVCWGQTAGWIKMSLGREVGLGPGNIALHGDRALPSPKRGTAPSIFRPMSIVAKHRPSQLLLSTCCGRPPPCVADADTIFLSCGFFLLLSSSFSPRLISAVADWMSTILLHMVWP